MEVNYLFSGINKESGFTKEQEKHLKEDIQPNSNITFISALPNDYIGGDTQVLQYTKLFRNIDITFKKVDLIDYRKAKKETHEVLKESDIIFLLGGSPELQMKLINEYELLDDIKQANIVLGVSAGSMNQSKRVMYRDDFDNFIMKDYSGLGIVDINIFPHIELNNETLMKEATEISNELPLILLPNDSFIRIKNKQMEIVGIAHQLFKEKILDVE